jgi:hypothetical protein
MKEAVLAERARCAALVRGNGERVVQDVREKLARAIEEGRQP